MKPVWAVATPKQPSAAIGRRSPLASLLFGSRTRKTPYMSAPPTENRSATSIIGGMASAAYFVAAKLSPQKTAAKTSATSVATAPRSPGPLTEPSCRVASRLRILAKAARAAPKRLPRELPPLTLWLQDLGREADRVAFCAACCPFSLAVDHARGAASTRLLLPPG